MNVSNPMHLENEIIIDVCENTICEICYDNYDYPTKYKCDNNNCNKNMCDTCFVNWTKRNNNYKCVYCTKPLEISSIPPELIDSSITIQQDSINENKKLYCLIKIPFIGGSSYLIGVVYTQNTGERYIYLNIMLGLITMLIIFGLKSSCCNRRQ